MTKRFDAFKAEYMALCEKHQLEIYPSDYDCLQVWQLDITQRACNFLQDRTGGTDEYVHNAV